MSLNVALKMRQNVASHNVYVTWRNKVRKKRLGNKCYLTITFRNLLRFVIATFSNSYVLWRKRCVMLRFVAVPFF